MESAIPKTVFAFIETKPNEIIYEICITLKDVRGAVFKTAKVLSDANVNLRTAMLFDAVEKGNSGYWTSFIDVAKAKKSIGQIEQDLRDLDVVQDIKIVKPEPLIYDVIHFPIQYGDSTAMIMPLELFGSLFEEIEKILTSSGFAAVFYGAGKKSGAHITELLGKKYGLSSEFFVSALIQSTRALGWGQLEDVKLDLHRPFCSVKIRKCFEAVLKGSRREAACHWTRGFIAGFLSEVVGKPLEAIEVKCAASGDELCEFEVCSRI